MKVKQTLQGIFWILVYLVLTLLPLFALLFGPRPEGREFWRELSVALGFAGLAMMALQFALTARFQVIKAPYGSDIVYFFHRQISVVAFLLVLAHPLILFVNQPETLGLLNIFEAPWRARAGVIGLLALLFVIGLSLGRRRLKIDYTRWRISHGLLATLAVGGAMLHVVLVGHYINTPLKAVLWIGYALFWTGLLLWVRVIKPWLLLRKPYEVVRVLPERGQAWTLDLKPVHHAGMKFMPGQFAWLTTWDTPFADREHPFSISSSAAFKDRLSFTIKELGDFTRRIKELQPGQRVYLDGPFGSFSIDRHSHAQGFIFIAGGIGITPMMSKLRTLADRGDPRPLTLIYANKDWESITFREELAALQDRLNLKVVHVLEQAPEGWEGETGFVNADLLARHLPQGTRRNEYEIFICGPQRMMDSVEKALLRLGVWIGDFHSERFNFV